MFENAEAAADPEWGEVRRVARQALDEFRHSVCRLPISDRTFYKAATPSRRPSLNPTGPTRNGHIGLKQGWSPTIRRSANRRRRCTPRRSRVFSGGRSTRCDECDHTAVVQLWSRSSTNTQWRSTIYPVTCTDLSALGSVPPAGFEPAPPPPENRSSRRAHGGHKRAKPTRYGPAWLGMKSLSP